ncbi:n-terminal fungal transcription regulatory domain-containing protein [Colletotrichum incanum]|uniref:N-terminal fungal transcription regulatory domain-containing protein n=1 Tax=Colletotrichum incanum TaxID=1573173 RepID=A0A161W6G1_COLIC|nr:n-terminal fungal transcription regulatory domain-containing protein [Colletotrichum incanum]
MKTRQPTVCNTCRSRKLGCDGKQPSCTQCLHSGRVCPGYHKDFVFRPPTTPRPAIAKARAGTNNPAGKGKPKAPNLVEKRTSSRNRTSITRALTWPVNDVLSLCVQNFVPSSELGSRTRDSSVSQSRICGAWIEELPELIGEGDDELLPCAIRALGTTLVARGRNGRAPISEAVRTQCLVLNILQHTINLRENSNHDRLAASIMCLYLSEKLLPTSSSGSLVHAKGISELIQLQPPSFYASGVSHRLFVGFRPLLILHSLTCHTSTFLAASEWLQGPFSHVHATPMQELMNEASRVPSILEKLDNCQAMNSVTETLARDAVDQLAEILGGFELCYRSIQESSKDALWWTSYGHGVDDISISFPNITMANYLTHFWAFWIVCVTQIRQLTAQFPGLIDQDTLANGRGKELTSELVRQKCLKLSRQIFLSIDYLLQDDMRIYGIASASYPLQIACATMETLGNGTEDMQLLRRRVDDGITQKGYDDFFQVVLK